MSRCKAAGRVRVRVKVRVKPIQGYVLCNVLMTTVQECIPYLILTLSLV